jgi:4-amino-4-deoxy-L-arabinose transferase-like glycosyltransferase
MTAASAPIGRRLSWAGLGTRWEDARWDRLAVVAIALGAGLRALWLFWLHPPQDHVFSDMAQYVQRATKLAAGISPTPDDTWQAPGPTLLLSIPFGELGSGRTGLFAAAFLWFGLSALMPVVGWRLARLWLTPAAGAITAAICALAPLQIMYSGYFLSETPALTLMLAAVWLAYRTARLEGRAAVVSALLAGACAGGLATMRPQLLLNVAIAISPLVIGSRRDLRALGAFLAAAAICASPGVIYTSVALGRLSGFDANSGLVFFHGRCHARNVEMVAPNYRFFSGSSVERQKTGGRDYLWNGVRAYDSGFFFEKGLDCVRQDGLGHVGRIAATTLDSFATTAPWPQADEPRWRGVANSVNLAWSWALLPLLATALLLARRWRELRLPLLHFACFLPFAMIFFGAPRYRQSYDVFAFILIAALAPRLIGAWRLRRAGPT